MFQVLESNKKPSFGQKFSNAVGAGLQGAGQLYQQHQQQKQQAQAAKTAKDMFGIDITGFDPDTQKALLVEAFKQQGKGSRDLQKQDFANKLFGGGQGQQSSPNNIAQDLQGQQPGQESSGMQQQIHQGFDASKISDEDILRASIIDPQFGNELQKLKDVALRENRENESLGRKEFGEERTYHTQFSKGAEERANSLRGSLPKQEAALNYARQAIESGETGAFTMNHLADLMGADSLRNSKGAQLILAAKEQLIPTLGRLSAKAQNQYMEKRMASMIPQVGAKDEANLSMQEMIEGEAEMDRAYVTEFDRLAEQDMKEHKFVKKDIEKRAQDAVKHKNNEILKRTSYRLKEIEEKEEGLSAMKEKVGKNVISGTALTLSMANLYVKKFGDNALDVAKKNGYYIPTREELMIFEQRPEQYRENL